MQDLRDAYRSLRAAPILSICAIASLTLGIGANTAIFSILNGLLLRPLPVREPSRLVSITEGSNSSFRQPVWHELRRRSIFQGAFAWSFDRFNLAPSGPVEFIDGLWVSGEFFDVLGVGPALGRPLTGADNEIRGGAARHAAMISYDFWRRRYGGAHDVIGQSITVDRVPLTIVGVTPKGFYGVNIGLGFDLVVPLGLAPILRGGDDGSRYVSIVARLKPSQTLHDATAALLAAQPAIRDATMPDYIWTRDRDAYLRGALALERADRGPSFLRRRYERALYTLLGVVAVVLIVACVNIANLLLARAAARRHELSVRLALGATRGRLVRQLVTESVLLSAAGAVAGLLVAQWLSAVLIAPLSTQAYTVVLDTRPDWRVLMFTASVAMTTGVLFGAAPALYATRASALDALARARGAPGDARAAVGGGLVVVQVALSLALAAGAGLFLRSFTAAAYAPVGFDRGRVLVAIVDGAPRPAGGSRVEHYERIRLAVAAVRNVESAAASLATPVGTVGNLRVSPLVRVDGSEVPEGRIHGNRVSPEWFRTYGTRVIAGRDFDARDRVGTSRTALVNEAFARRYFKGANPVGRTVIVVETPADRRILEIIGFVADAAYTSIREPVQPAIYMPFSEQDDEFGSWSSINISVRAASGPPARLTREVAAAIARVDPRAVITFRSLSDQVSATYLRERLLAMVSVFFGGLTLLLAALGLYGVTAHAVTRRRMELGIRLALGAGKPSILRVVLGRVVLLMAAGIAAGIVLTFWAGRFVAGLLYNLRPHDPVTLIGAAVTLAVVGVVAGWVPARRAVRIDPAQVLREG